MIEIVRFKTGQRKQNKKLIQQVTITFNIKK